MITERKFPLVVIFTAIPVEHHAVQAHIKHLREEIHPQGTIYTRGIFGSWNVAIVHIGIGKEVAALEGERAVNHLQPDIILFVGVAEGIKDVRIGDVVAATKVYGYEFGKVEDNSFHSRPNVVRPTYRMEQRARAVARKSDWLNQLIGPSPIQMPTVYVGPVASGEKILASTRSSLWTFLQSHYNDILAVETEGHGMLSVAYANPQIEALVIRGIANIVDEKHTVEDLYAQGVAARHASAFAFALLNSLSEDERFKEQNSDHMSDEGVPLVVYSPNPEKKVNHKQLHQALLHAFPNRDELRMLVLYEMQQNLDAIANDSTLNTTIFDLIGWAESRGYTEKLLQSALHTRPDNELIKAIAKQAGIELTNSSPLASMVHTEQRPVLEEDTKKYQTDDRDREDRVVSNMELDTETIFIARDRQVDSFRSLFEIWHALELSTINADIMPSPNNKLQGPIVLIYGEGGLGKSRLLEQYRVIATEPNYQINGSSIIDWESRSYGGWLFSSPQAGNEIDACEYYSHLCKVLAKALNKRDEDFVEYSKAQKAIGDALGQVEKIIKKLCIKDDSNASVKAPYAFLRLLNTQKMRKVLQAYSTQDSDQAVEKIKILLGKNVEVRGEHLTQFVESIKRKLGTAFDDYLQPMHRLGTALGTDLHFFAEKGLLLIFFDSYEQAMWGDSLLRIVMHTAGTKVGWVIAGRYDLWSVSNQIQGYGAAYSYKDIVHHKRALSIDLDSQPFLVEDIMTYFAIVHQSYPSLPIVKKEDGERIFHITGGIPLAVRIVAEIYAKRQRLDFLREVVGKTEIASRFVDYYFRHVIEDEVEQAQLYGLTLLRRINNPQATAVSLGLKQEHIHSNEQSLKKLQRNYQFLFTGQKQIHFYQEIRRLLRLWMLNEQEYRKVENIVKCLRKVYQNQLNALEKSRSYRDIQSRLEDDEWVETYLDLAEVLYWFDIREGVLYNLLFLVAAVAYRPEAYYDAMQIGTFFEAHMKQPVRKWWSLLTQSLYDPLNMYAVEAQAKELKDLATLLREGKFNCTSFFASYIQELEALVWWQLGKVCYQNHGPQEALDWYKKALVRLPSQQDLQEEILNIYWIQANNAYQQESYEDSISFLDEALTIKYNFADAYYSKGNVYHAAKNYQRAIVNYQYAIEFDIGHFYAYVNLGNIHYEQGRYKAAIEEYNQSIKLDDTDARMYYNRANAYAMNHAYPAALQDFEHALQLDPMHSGAYLNRGHIYALLQRYKEALEQYRQAFELAPERIQVAWTWHWANFTNVQPDKKDIPALEKIAALDETHYVAYLCRAIALWLEEREPETVLLELNQAKELQPEEWDPYFWSGMFLAMQEQPIQAQEMINKALKLDLPPLLLAPLHWLEAQQPDFFLKYVQPILKHHHLL